MVALRDLMLERYGGWRDDLLEDGGWRELFQNAPAPNAHDIPAHFEVDENIPVWPGRREADQARHICRPFEGISPQDVRVIVLGQDPYPDPQGATGRSFEDGTPDGTGRPIKPSLRRLALSALDVNGGQVPVGLCHRPQARFAYIRERFDGLVAQGVLFLNAAWTRSNNLHLDAHMKFWSPVITFTIIQLMVRPHNPASILLLGTFAQDVFEGLNAEINVAERAIPAFHPMAWSDTYLESENPLRRVNAALAVQDNGNPIAWWP